MESDTLVNATPLHMSRLTIVQGIHTEHHYSYVYINFLYLIGHNPRSSEWRTLLNCNPNTLNYGNMHNDILWSTASQESSKY
jgi:hypothetical protein